MAASLAWISADEIVRYKYRSQRVEVLLYSAQTCQICQSKLIPIFDDLSRWSLGQWKSKGLVNAKLAIRMSALDTSKCQRPNIPEVKGVVTVPYVQMWAPSGFEYEPLRLDLNFENMSYDSIKQRLVDWIVKNVNEIE
ncbi:hypothetical protein BOX15_Mlig018679g3 [Macrostomum lignano]|uniref:Thioredoxin domain-containing protein n=1 Tax=Macrostomum lignano TaxID=282301 RepID=A0A267GI07_9PLAT|nr:hypothetical protein BOX15_Mlig018679g3 [Macrostomum lignano]